ncbi:MAG: hypothetical protein NE328_03045 [Lentisphaeraceae bacterium]|nr:hypothetical protein [Lentisphaeraceae bacterium]
MIEGLPDYLAICSRAEKDQLESFNDVFSTNHSGSEFQFLDFEDEEFTASDDESYYMWLEAGEVSAEFGGYRKELHPGDVIALSPDQSISFFGKGEFWAIKSRTSRPLPFSGISRLCELEDTSGGCNNSENAFRRLQIVWEDTKDPKNPDGDNVVGCHVIWIAADSSRSHYHPVPPTEGGRNQQEMYLVLDPKDFGLKSDCGTPGVWTYPEYGRWDEPYFTPLKPGDVFFIAAPAVHRAVDILTCVVALPGFKPDNDRYIDQDIYDQSNGQAPCNFNRVIQSTQ